MINIALLLYNFLQALRRRIVLELRDCYVTLSFAKLKDRLAFSTELEVEETLCAMSREGLLSASIDKSTGFVALAKISFSEEQNQSIAKSMERIFNLGITLTSFSRQLECSGAFIRRQTDSPSHGMGFDLLEEKLSYDSMEYGDLLEDY
eukprot:TRINITY_DN38623_c0_g2_i1.p2 TRINITY_DN38623_c0_g2~~TRINITY_DN38623_c0_g2_i1.p2  ORF type:complete len:149 (-),score=3.92 TRINITY_DN38623_c0_g2_i1:82-528(-)